MRGERPQSILQREGIRQLPGICRYPDKRTGQTVNQGGTADHKHSSLTEMDSVGGVFLCPPQKEDRQYRTREKERGT